MDRPEPSVACYITKESALGVGASHDDTFSWVGFHIDTICLTELIILSGNKGLYNLDLRLTDTAHLADFKYP